VGASFGERSANEVLLFISCLLFCYFQAIFGLIGRVLAFLDSSCSQLLLLTLPRILYECHTSAKRENPRKLMITYEIQRKIVAHQ
jgi:hypothetical protein